MLIFSGKGDHTLKTVSECTGKWDILTVNQCGLDFQNHEKKVGFLDLLLEHNLLSLENLT